MIRKLIKKITTGDNIYFFRMYKFAKPHLLPFAIGQFFYSAQGFVFPFAMSLLAGNIMEAMVARSRDMVLSAVINFVYISVVFMVLLGFGIALYIYYRERIMQDVKQDLFRSFMKTTIEESTNSHSGVGIAAINTDANNAAAVFGQPLTNFLGNIITITGSTATIFVLDWRLGLAAAFVGSLSFIFQIRFTKPLAEIGKERLERNAETVKTASNIFNGSVAIRAFNTQPKALLTFDADNSKIKLLDFKKAVIDTYQTSFTIIESWLSLVVTFVFGGWLVATGRLEFHLLVVVFGMFASLVGAIGSIGMTYAGLQVPIAGAKRVFEILDKGNGPVKEKVVLKTDKPNGYNILIDNLNFAYSCCDNENKSLKNIDIEIKENEMVAFVGESGSGKSTLLRTIIGLYDREDLGISLGNVSFTDVVALEWRNNFAFVDQSCKLFDMTISENIAMGKKGCATKDEIETAAIRASADFINELPDGFDTNCGESGASLSGGQKQRIAIARALVKKAPILVFDEATSALDNDSEKGIFQTINDLRGDHTVLVVTHNLRNIANADKIVVMKNGEIVEMGTHEHLLGLNGEYVKLLGGV